MSLTEIDPESLDRLSPEEVQELMQHLEVLREDRCRRDICFFAENIDIPGTPPPMTEAQRAKLRDTSRRNDILDDDFVDDEDDEFYPRTVELAAHHRMILESVEGMLSGEPLTGVVDGQVMTCVPDGIMLFLPPGSAKSTFASVLAPAYLMGRFPALDVISASYGAVLAHRFARRVRHIVRDPFYQRIFRTEIVTDNQAVNQWALQNGSGFLATGLLGAVTGFRADLLGIDDPIAGIEEADSDIIREKTYQAIINDLFTRLKPGGKVILTQTRWHEDDPAGRLLGDKWKGQSGLWRGTDKRIWLVVNMPMLAEQADDPLGRRKGEQLWPEWFRPEEVKRLSEGNQRTWSALYQQRPAASEGTIIFRDLWRCWPHGDVEPTEAQLKNPLNVKLPESLFDCFLCYDTAFEEEEETNNDPSAMVCFGMFKHTTMDRTGKQVTQNHMLMIDGWSEHIDAIDLFERVAEDRKKFRPRVIVIEKRASGIQLIQALRQRRWDVYSFLPQGKPGKLGKVSRAKMSAYFMDGGTVWYMPNARTKAIIDQCAAFPFAKNDDWVDCVTSGIEVARRDDFEIVHDLLDPDEAEEEERLELEARARGRRLYGSSGGGGTSAPPTGVRRGYGRI